MEILRKVNEYVGPTSKSQESIHEFRDSFLFLNCLMGDLLFQKTLSFFPP